MGMKTLAGGKILEVVEDSAFQGDGLSWMPGAPETLVRDVHEQWHNRNWPSFLPNLPGPAVSASQEEMRAMLGQASEGEIVR